MNMGGFYVVLKNESANPTFSFLHGDECTGTCPNNCNGKCKNKLYYRNHGVFNKNMKCKILIIEDDPVNVLIYESILKSSELDYSHKVANNGHDALQMLNDFYPEIIILDIRMPVMDGLEFLSKLKQLNARYKRTKVIVAQCGIVEEEEEDEEEVIVIQPPVDTTPTDLITAGAVTTPTLTATEEKSLFESKGFLVALIVGEVLLVIIAILIVVAVVKKRGE